MVVVDKVPDYTHVVFQDLKNDQVFCTRRDTRCLQVLLNQLPCWEELRIAVARFASFFSDCPMPFAR